MSFISRNVFVDDRLLFVYVRQYFFPYDSPVAKHGLRCVISLLLKKCGNVFSQKRPEWDSNPVPLECKAISLTTIPERDELPVNGLYHFISFTE